MTQKRQREQALTDWINSSTSYHCNSLKMVSGDASFRRYFRFIDDSTKKSIVAVDAPPKYEDSETFIAVAKAYKNSGVRVPDILSYNNELGFYCIEDFGDGQFAQALSADSMFDLYHNALAQLPSIQSCTSANGQSLPLFDAQLLEAEKYLFTHWLLEKHLDLKVSPNESNMIDEAYSVLTDNFFAQPQVGVHRDYHSRNLMMLDDLEIGVIDFQDAVIGPITYDAVSLLRDCYQNWPESEIKRLLKALHKQYYQQYSWEDFERWFDLTGIQRHIKASGIFCRLWLRDGKSGYLKDVPHTLDYIIDVGNRYSQTSALATYVDQVVKPAMLSTLE